MKKRMIVMLIAVAVFIAAIGAIKVRQVRGAMAQGASFHPPPESVTTAVAKQEEWPSTVAAMGSVTSVQGVTVSADLPGIVEKINFESGKWVRKGDVLVKLDTSQEEAQLRAADSQRDLARLNLERMKGLKESGVISQSDYDRAAAEFTQGEARVGEIRATMERKTIRAPFSGVLGIRQVNLGQYMAGGDPIVPLQSLQPVAAVQLTAEGGIRSTGTITAMDSVVNDATRNIQVQATFANQDHRLRPGMFVETQVILGASNTVITLPSSAISYAPYGDSVYIVEDMKGPDGKPYRGVRQQFVKL